MGWIFSLEEFDPEIANIIDRFDEILRELREFEDDRIRKVREKVDDLYYRVIEYIIQLKNSMIAKCDVCGEKIGYKELLAQELIFGDQSPKYCKSCAEKLGFNPVINLLIEVAEKLSALIPAKSP